MAESFDFLELIPSKTMRTYLKKIGHVFTDSEQATIIYNLELPYPKRDELLQKIALHTSDEGLRKQIEQRISFDREELVRLEEELAIQPGKEMETGGIWHNAQGEVIGYWSENEYKMWDGKRTFEERYIDMPHPFSYGDKVQVLGEQQKYTVGGFQTKEEERERLEAMCKRMGVERPEECLDYMDIALYLSFEHEDGEKDHTHVLPLYVEFVGKPGYPRYELHQPVEFTCPKPRKRGEEGTSDMQTLIGLVYILDPYGTFSNPEEPSYDIMGLLNGERCLYKHIPESEVRGLTEEEITENSELLCRLATKKNGV